MNSLQKYVFPTIPPNKTQKNLHIFSDNTSQLRTLPQKRGTFSEKRGRKKKKRRRFSEKCWRFSEKRRRFFHTPLHSFLSPWESPTNPPRGRAKSTTALLTFQHSHARAYARTSAILYFLLSQPSHSLRSSVLISPWYQGIILLKSPTFFEKTPTFLEKSPTFSRKPPRVVDNTPIFPFSPPHPLVPPVVDIPLFSSHFPWFFALFPRFSKWMQINRLYLVVP